MAKTYLSKEGLAYYHTKVLQAIDKYITALDLKDGVTPNITIGEVETLQPGSEVTVTITGTPENPILNIGIPAGEDGVLANSSIENIDAVVKSIEESQSAINQQITNLNNTDSSIIKRIDTLESKVDTSLDNGAVKIDTSGIVLKNNANLTIKGEGNTDSVVLDEDGGKFNNIITEKITFGYHQAEKSSVDDDLEVTGFFFVGGGTNG